MPQCCHQQTTREKAPPFYALLNNKKFVNFLTGKFCIPRFFWRKLQIFLGCLPSLIGTVDWTEPTRFVYASFSYTVFLRRVLKLNCNIHTGKTTSATPWQIAEQENEVRKNEGAFVSKLLIMCAGWRCVSCWLLRQAADGCPSVCTKWIKRL